MADNPTPNWQPISMLPTIAGIIDGELTDAEEHYATLLQAREKPYVLDDEIVDRTIRLHTEQLEFLWVYQEQLVRWRQADQDPILREEIDRLAGQLGRLHTTLTNILTLAAELSKGTIDKILAKSDLEMGIEALLRGEF